MTYKPEVAIVGMGYVGLTLAATLADLGIRVWGYERQEEVARHLNNGRPPLFEPGVEEVLQRRIGDTLTVETHMPPGFSGVTIICVSTPFSPEDHAPDLRNLKAAVQSVAESTADGAPVMVRSTVPVGTCRRLALPILQRTHRRVRLTCCPERTIQGRALEELRQLPQVIGGLDGASTDVALEFWQRVTPRVIPLSSLEAAEMVKLINNSHTDVLYSFGNEVAMIAHRLGLDPMELIKAANLDYPRPDLARPGFVAGPCMTKDPYLLLSSLHEQSYVAGLVRSARILNESLPDTVARHFVTSLEEVAGSIDGAKVFICGFAYKGFPPTDDIRGTPALPIVNVLREQGLRLVGHDYLVPADGIAAFGVTPLQDVHEGFEGARGVLFINEHPDYRRLDISQVAGAMQPPAVLYDCWRMFDARTVESAPGVHYRGIGYG